MNHLTPQKIAEITGGEYVGNESSRFARIVGAVRDNREVKAGNLFVCIQGKRVDGHSFANSAFESGAACCLVERRLPDATGPYVITESSLEAIKIIAAYHRSLFGIPVIGVTGSVGKTTAKELIAAALGMKFRVLKTLKNLNNELGVPLTLLSLNEQHEVAVVEMGISDFGEMSRLAKMVRPDYFVITKIGYAHLEALGDLHGVLRAKTEAFAHMKASGVAILCGDDELLWNYDPGMRRVTYGTNERNDIIVSNARPEGTGAITCDLSTGGLFSGILSEQQGSRPDVFRLRIPAYGGHIAELAGAAAAVGLLLGLTEPEIAHGLLAYEPVGSRANVTDTGMMTLIDDCYNANPNSVRAALTSLSAIAGHRVAILGDMLELGTQSNELHREIGVFAARCGIDRLICCGDKASFIHDGYITAGGMIGGNDNNSESESKAHYYPTKEKLIADLPALIKKDDAVLVKASNGMKFNEIAHFLRLRNC